MELENIKKSKSVKTYIFFRNGQMVEIYQFAPMSVKFSSGCCCSHVTSVVDPDYVFLVLWIRVVIMSDSNLDF